MAMKRSNRSVVEKKRAAGRGNKEKIEYRRAAGSDSSDEQVLARSQASEKGAKKAKRFGIFNRQRAELKRSSKKEDGEVRERSGKREKTARVRVFPIWLRIIVVLILTVFALASGLMIGYGVIGDGTPIDALKVETWQHIIDIVIKE